MTPTSTVPRSPDIPPRHDALGLTCPVCGRPLPASRLQQWRQARGLRLVDVGVMTGVSAATLCRMERGDVVRVETLRKVAEGIGMAAEELVGQGIRAEVSS